jgi:hypothetical protein
MTPTRYVLRSSIGEFPLGAGDHLVGRGFECDVRLDDGLVSRRHAVVTVDDGKIIVQDLNSRNGTRVNGVRVTRQMQLGTGDRLLLGPYQLELVDRERPARPRTPAPTPSGAYTRSPSTFPPATHDWTDDATKVTGVFGTLTAAVDAALRSGRLDEAEFAAGNLLLSLRAEALRGGELPERELRRATQLALDLVELTGRVRWIERTLDLMAFSGRVLEEPSLALIERLSRKFDLEVQEPVRAYVERLRKANISVPPGPRQRLSRLEAFDQLRRQSRAH